MRAGMSELVPDMLRDLVVAALDAGKAQGLNVFDVRSLTTITDFMVIASGRSSRQVKALATRVVDSSRAQGLRPLGIEGLSAAQWILVDFGDVIVHIMQSETREFYQLEKLWDVDAGRDAGDPTIAP